MKKEVFIVVDIGTSYIKCGCVTIDRDVLVDDQRKFPMIQDRDNFEVDFELFFTTTKELINLCLEDQRVQDFTIGALLITSQANTFAPVDADFNPLDNGIVWLDERAEKEAAYLNEKLSKFSKTAGFNRPVSGQYISKLLWLKKNKTKTFKRARYFPLINEYLAYKLTKEFYSDTTSFGMSGMYDFSRSQMNTKLLDILGLTNQNFPKIKNAGEKGVSLSNEMMLALNVTNNFPVFLCGNDQTASASGSGLKNNGDVTINFGSAMVLFSITNNLVTDLSTEQISGKYPVGGAYFLLSYESDFGIKIRELKESLFRNDSYDELFQTYVDFPEVEVVRPGFSDADLIFNSTKEACQFCAGIIKYYLIQLKTYIKNIREQVNINRAFLSGGMAKSTVWLQIIKKELELTFTIKNQSNAGLVGAVNIYLSNKN